MSSIIVSPNSSVDNNISQNNRFEMFFSKLENVSYTLNSVNIPGISINNPEVSTVLNRVHYGADSAQFDNLQIQFLVQEDLFNYFELHDWMRAISFPDSFSDSENIERFGGESSHAILTINSSYNRPIYRFHFFHIQPATLSSIDFTASSSDEIIANATFNYTIFRREIVPILE